MSTQALAVAMEREDWCDYIDQGCVMYCPPAQYSPDIESQKVKYSYLASISARFLASPQYTRPTKKTIDALNVRGYALDNGAYLCYTKNKPFDNDRFLLFCARYGKFADWIVLPDVVCDAKKTLENIPVWRDKIRAILPRSRLLMVWQDGMEPSKMRPYMDSGIGVFVGGSTVGKLSAMHWIADLCREYNVWCHVGRVNSVRRLEAVLSCGAHSFDGSGIVRYLPTLERMSAFLRVRAGQYSLFNTRRLELAFLRDWLNEYRELI